MWDHIKYEWVQRVSAGEKISFIRQEWYYGNFHHLMDTLDKYIRSHDHNLAQDAAAAQNDIAAGTAAAEWLSGAVFCSADRIFAEQTPASLAGETFVTG
jgi:hypothetical protein